MPTIQTLHPSLTARTLADFMTASQTTQRRIVHTNKYPDDPESVAIASYYRDVRSAVKGYFAEGRALQVIDDRLARLEAAKASTKAQRQRIDSNLRSLSDFRSSELAQCDFSILETPAALLTFGQVSLTLQPTFAVKDNLDQLNWLHVDFSAARPDEDRIKIILQLMLLAAQKLGAPLKPKCAAYYHLGSNSSHTAKRVGARLEKDIAAACQTFADIWNAI